MSKFIVIKSPKIKYYKKYEFIPADVFIYIIPY